MVKAKGENPFPSEKTKDGIIFRVFLKVEIRSLTLINNSSYRVIKYKEGQIPVKPQELKKQDL